MPIFKVSIDGFGDLPVTPPFLPRAEIVRSPNGEIQRIEESWRFRGILPGDGTFQAGLKATRDSILGAFQQASAGISFTADGSIVERIGPETHVRGGFFRNFDVRESGAEWLSLLEYEFEVVGLKAVSIPDVTSFSKSTTFREDADGNLTVTVNVEAVGPGALAFVQASTPAAARLASTITIADQEDRVSGTFEIPPEGSDTPNVVESVEIERGVFELSFARPTKAEKPEPFWGAKLPTLIRLSGSATLQGLSPEHTLAVPVPRELAKFISGRPRIRRDVAGRAGSTKPQKSFKIEYSVEIESPDEIELDDLIKGRQKLSATKFSAKIDDVKSGIVET